MTTDTVATLKQQLLHLQQLHASGVLDQSAYDQARAGLERKLLDLVMAGDAAAAAAAAAPMAATPTQVGRAGSRSTPPAVSEPRPRLRRSTIAAAAVFVLLVGAGGYLWTGSPALVGEKPGQAQAAQDGQGGGNSHALGMDQIEGLVTKLKERLAQKPDDAQGWAMLGRSLAVLGRAQEALPAYEKAVKLVGDDANLLADYADVMALANNRSLDGEPM
ncbi:MAG: hypothetical protein RL722_1594, partial [Pseudomonadota bacterium]